MAIRSWKKFKSVLGLKPGLRRQIAVALPLVPPPLSLICLIVGILTDYCLFRALKKILPPQVSGVFQKKFYNELANKISDLNLLKNKK